MSRPARLGILGWPVSHSKSPAIHGAVHAALGIEATYERLAVEPADLVPAVRGLGALGFLGANVTIPHKQAVVGCCDHLTDEAQLVGAVNTLHWTADGLVGDNTDARGFVNSLDEDAPGWTGPAVILGTGGAARAVVVGLARRGVAICVAGRRAEAAADLAQLATVAGAVGASSILASDDDLATRVREARLVVNATPLGMHEERLPEPLMELEPGQVAADLVYAPPMTPFLTAAADRGARAVGGIGMLVHQAALSAARWHEVEPPVGACRSAVEASS